MKKEKSQVRNSLSKQTALTMLLAMLVLAATGCAASSYAIGNALLPSGIEQAQLPNVDINGYLYVDAGAPIDLPVSSFSVNSDGAALSESGVQQLELQRATIVIGPSTDSFGGTLEFASEHQAEEALRIFQTDPESENSWGDVSSTRLLLAHGASSWTDSVRNAFESQSLSTLPEHNSGRWSIVTNLPKNPPSRPVAAGAISIGAGLPGELADLITVDLRGIDTAFGLVRVDTLGFGVYSDSPVEVPGRIDRNYLENAGYGVLLVSKSSYPGVLVSFMLGVIAGRTDMETINIGKTNARYRQVEGVHLILKNKGSLMFAAIAGSRQNAESLILSAISD